MSWARWLYRRLGVGGEICRVELGDFGYYLKGCTKFNLWTDHSPLVQAMKKEVWEFTLRMQKFREAIQPYKICMSFVKGIHNHLINVLSMSPVVGSEGIKES